MWSRAAIYAASNEGHVRHNLPVIKTFIGNFVTHQVSFARLLELRKSDTVPSLVFIFQLLSMDHHITSFACSKAAIGRSSSRNAATTGRFDWSDWSGNWAQQLWMGYHKALTKRTAWTSISLSLWSASVLAQFDVLLLPHAIIPLESFKRNGTTIKITNVTEIPEDR